MRRLLAAKAAELLQLQPIRMLFLVLARRVIALLTFGARKGNNLLHQKYQSIFELWATVPRDRYGESNTPRFWVSSPMMFGVTTM